MFEVAMFAWGTKAETLERLQPLVKKSAVLELYYFSVEEWLSNSSSVLYFIRKRFSGSRLVIRSSAYNEDSALSSMAGAYTSALDIDGSDEDAITEAIEKVIASYSGNPLDQVLVQPMVDSVAMSGVIFTHDLHSGAPYYVINYDDESGKTDAITGGTGVNKTVVVHHEAAPGYIESARIADLVEMARELELICGGREPLDIEFAQDRQGRLFLLQLRRITVQRNWNRTIRVRVSDALYYIEQFFAERSQPRRGLPGSKTVLGQMPDWNPAEIIGTHPRRLAVSLYRYLVTDSVWQEARALMGYRAVPNEALLLMIAGKPYIDVRNSFASFLPEGLDAGTETRIVDAWLDRLARHPEFHDKVEFQVAQTAYDFSFEGYFEQRYGDILGNEEFTLYRERLRALTRENLEGLNPSLADAFERIETLRLSQERRNGFSRQQPLQQAISLLEECKSHGTLPFAVIARHAFIAETLLRSAIERGAFSAVRLDEFKRSLKTVAGEFTQDYRNTLSGELGREEFLKRYGHLRPGTYDILSLRYDQRPDIFRDVQIPSAHRSEAFQLSAEEEKAFALLLKEAGFGCGVEDFFAYCEKAIIGREYSKFIFTKNLSDALECIVQWGEGTGLTRDDLSYLSMDEIFETLNSPVLSDKEIYFLELAETRRRAALLESSVQLGYIVRDVRDIYVVPLHRSAPNFVSNKSIEGNTVCLDSRMSGSPDLFNRIVCIENADPGFDWIFTRGIAGLVSKFGGANSHMTIRCAELGIPAAIGVGEQTFERLVNAGRIELNCPAKIVRPLVGNEA